jgi:Sigma-70, region 4
MLRYYSDLSQEQIAAAMGISRGAVKSHTARGLSALRSALEQSTPPTASPRTAGTSLQIHRLRHPHRLPAYSAAALLRYLLAGA